MGLLDDLLGGAFGGAEEQQTGRPQRGAPAPAGGMGQVMTTLLPVVLAMLSNRGGGQAQSGGGLGDILGQALGADAPRGSGASRGGGGGGLGDLLGGLLGGDAGGAGGAGSLGGLGALLQQMQNAGFADQARSWVGTGQNMPISPDALSQIFGEGSLDEIAARTGLSRQQTSQGLSELLPEVVDRVTPGGRVPDLDQLTQSVDNMRRRMGG